MTKSSQEKRGLVLGGGGIAGIAWETGLIIGLAEQGIDLAAADVVVGTSAGSLVGAGLRSGNLAASLRSQPSPAESGANDGAKPEPGAASAGSRDIEPLMTLFVEAEQGTAGEQETRALFGKLALSTTDAQPEAERLAHFRQLVPAEWPDGELRITAVNATDGAFRVIDAHAGVELPRAIAASCAVPGVYAPISLDGTPFMDGGMRSGTNADAASDCDRILVLACFPEPLASKRGPTLVQAVEELRQSAQVLVITADPESLEAFGPNPLLASARMASAEAGRRQAGVVAEEILRFWG